MIKTAFYLGFFWAAGPALACDDLGVPLIPSTQDAPRALIVHDDVPLAQPFSLNIVICEDAAVGSINIDAMMPAHQHGMNYTPTIIDLGDDVFQVDGMLFHMPALWEIQVELIKETNVIRYSHTVIVQ